ncbi:MAG: hypothetical protein E7603_02690 [Ruminococcaceae bacterium]|nr:hypothetical protein [Oscillospiraceae bacterium]
MGKIFFNEDPNHFVISRKLAGYKRITMEDARNFILQYKDTQITDFFVCLGASGAWYDSQKTDNIIQTYRRWVAEGKTNENETNAVVSSVRLVENFYKDYGTSLQAVWLDTLREIGINPWISIRMNDIHEAGMEESILHSEFYRKNRHKNRVSHREPAGYYDYALDYMFEEVREHYLTMIEEALERFDVQGVELDFMREIYSIGVGREYEGIAVINAFMRKVYALVQNAEKRLGHTVKIAVRLPDTPEKALRLGFDFFDWVEAGIVDCITVTPRWASSDNHMPIDLWKKILKGKNVTLAAGQEILIGAYNRRGFLPQYNTYETAIATACTHHFQKADAIYLFNYMDAIKKEESLKTADGRDYSLCLDRDIYKKFLCTAGDYDSAAAAHRRHLVTYNDVHAIGVAARKQLPVRLSGKRENPTGFSALRIATGKISPSQCVSVILGFSAGATFETEDLRVYLNAKPCRFAGEQAPYAQQYPDMKYYRFEAENNGNFSPVSVIEVGVCEGRTELHWAEIEISEEK